MDGQDASSDSDALFEKLAKIKHDSDSVMECVKGYRQEAIVGIKRIAGYEISRLEYKLNLERYRYSADPNAGEKHERDMKHRIFGVKLQVFKAIRFEKSDQRRYHKAMSLSSETRGLSATCRSDVIEKYKARLLMLLEERAAIELELSRLYAEKYKEFIRFSKDKKYLRIRLRAARKAYRRYKELSRSVSKYIFSPDDKIKLFEYINKSIELSSELAVLKHKYRFSRLPEAERAVTKRGIAEAKRERARSERNVNSLLAKARRRTYFYGENGVLRWAVGFAIVIALIIAAFCIFYEPITAMLN